MRGRGVRRRSTPRQRYALGLLAIGFYALHGSYHVAHYHPEELLWACHLGALLVGIGWLVNSATANAIGFLWLTMGDALWSLDLATGGEFLPTSLLTHVGGLLLSVRGLQVYGMPRHAWWQAVVAFLAVQQLCRWVTPPTANVNLAFSVWSGWEHSFPSYGWYLLMLVAIGLAVCFTLGQLSRRVFGGSAERRGVSLELGGQL